MARLTEDVDIVIDSATADTLAAAYKASILADAQSRAAQVDALNAQRKLPPPDPDPEKPLPKIDDSLTLACETTAATAQSAMTTVAQGIANVIAASAYAAHETAGWRHNVAKGTITLKARRAVNETEVGEII